MGGFIYLIKSIKNGRLYLGSTDNPTRRISEHNNQICEATRDFIPWKCILIINLEDLTIARKVEYYIKRQKEKLTVQNIIKILNRYFENNKLYE
jgi:putative endonuclease